MLEVFIPVVGMAPDDVMLTGWLYQPGDQIETGAVVAVVETSKTQLEIEAEGPGRLGAHLVEVDARVAPGTVIARILGPDESEEPVDAINADAGQPAVGRSDDVLGTVPATPPSSTGPRHQLSPRQRREQAEADAAAPTPLVSPATPPSAPLPVPPPPPRPAPPPPANSTDSYRRAIATSVSRSWAEIPHFSVQRELRVGALIAITSELRAVLPGLTLTDLLLRAYALALVEHTGSTQIDLGLATATERGVAIPVVTDVLSRDLPGLIRARAAAVTRARGGRLDADDRRVPISTLSNLGAVGVDSFTGIIPIGQTSLLTVGSAAPRPVVENGELAVTSTMHATVTVDHREWDGLHVGQLLQRLADILTRPGLVGPLGSVTNPIPYREEPR